MKFLQVLPRDNRDLTELEFERARSLCDEIGVLVDRPRDGHFASAQNNWKQYYNSPANPSSPVRHGEYAFINRLRFHTYAFTGYQLMTLNYSNDWHPTPERLDEWLMENRQVPDSNVEALAVLIPRLPSGLVFSPPRMLGEIGWDVGGVIANHDTYAYQERIALMHDGGVLDRLRGLGRTPRVLEIGGGYGGLALALHQILGPLDYTICDLPESLLFSGLYLTLAGGITTTPGALRLLPNYDFASLAPERFDLVINTLSMSEMSVEQVEIYARGIVDLLAPGGVFFEQNQDNREIPGVGVYAKTIIEPLFPYRRTIESTLLSWPTTQGIADLWSVEPSQS